MPRRAYRVYVLELDDAVGPRRNPEHPWVYVGQTAHPIDARIAQHIAGDRLSAREVRDHFVRHRPDLDPAGPVTTRERAEELEREVSIALYELGYGVLGDGLPPLLRRRQAGRRGSRGKGTGTRAGRARRGR